MEKNLKTYGLFEDKGSLLCNFCRIEINEGKIVEGMYCPKCGTIFPYVEKNSNKKTF
jgi:hypothetical protein